MMSDDIDTESSEPKWMIDEDTPGAGDRPEWLPDKFKKASDLGKSYRELERKIINPPEDYDVSKSKFIDPEFEGFQNLKKTAKENRVSQEMMNSIIDTFDSYAGQFEIDQKAEIEKLGEGSKEMLTRLDTWVENNIPKENADMLFSQVRTADGIKSLEMLRKSVMDNQSQVPGHIESSEENLTLQDVQKELTNNLDRYKEDPKYRREIRQKLSKFAGESKFVDKIGS